MAAAYEGKTVKQWLMDLARVRLAEMEKRGILRRGRGETLALAMMQIDKYAQKRSIRPPLR